MAKMKTLTLNNVKYAVDDAEAVKFTEQSLSNKQKAQARKNIGVNYGYEINPDLNLVVFGDSLFGKEHGKTFIKGLGCNIQNYAVSGASLAEVSDKLRDDETYNSVLDQYNRFKSGQYPYLDVNEDITTRLNGVSDFEYPDIILVDGGGNDYLVGATMGTPNSEPYVYEANKTYDTSTVMGALETLLRDIAMTYPKAQRFFLIMHRVNYCFINSSNEIGKAYWSTTVNKGGYAYDTLRENIIKICNMYGFKIIDIYNDSLLNVTPPSQISYNGKQVTVANADLLDWKGIHPTELGYQLGYEPYVKQALCLGTKKIIQKK